jgi:hypothetical protein
MDYPSDDAVGVFLELCRGVQFSTEGGVMAVRVPDPVTGWRWVEVAGAALDELVEKGWVELVGEDEIEATERGVYWARRWVTVQARLARKSARGRSR